VTAAKVRQHSLGAAVFRPGVLPTPSQPAAPLLQTTTVSNDVPPVLCPQGGCPATYPAGLSATTTVPCPTGTQVLSGGYLINPAMDGKETATASAPVGNGWGATFALSETNPVAPLGTVYAVCGKLTG
jgi:hypothetical protein